MAQKCAVWILLTLALESSDQVTQGLHSLTNQAENGSHVESSVFCHCSGCAETQMLSKNSSLYNHFACSGAKERGRIFGKEGWYKQNRTYHKEGKGFFSMHFHYSYSERRLLLTWFPYAYFEQLGLSWKRNETEALNVSVLRIVCGKGTGMIGFFCLFANTAALQEVYSQMNKLWLPAVCSHVPCSCWGVCWLYSSQIQFNKWADN